MKARRYHVVNAIIECSHCDHEYYNLREVADDYVDSLLIPLDKLKKILATIPEECIDIDCQMPFNSIKLYISMEVYTEGEEGRPT